MQSRGSKSREALREEAAQWYAKLQNEPDPDTMAQFAQWRSDPLNAAAFESIWNSHQSFGLFRHSPDYQPGAAKRLAAHRREGSRYALALAATLVLAVALVFLAGANPLTLHETRAIMLKTNIGEIRRVRLSDGSNVTLDTSTRVDVEIGRMHRSARVRYGRARFEVAAASMPFTVQTGDAITTVPHGTIDVEHEGKGTRVNVLSGTAQLKSGDGADARELTLGTHEAAVSHPQGAVQTYRMSVPTDWTKGMLQFDGTAVSDAATLANRYSDERIVVDGDVGQLKVTGAFRAGDNGRLARALAVAFGLSLRQAPDGNWHLADRHVARSQH